MSIDLPLIWGGIIALAVFMYVLMDGFDLGLGILFPFMKSEDDRDVAMNSVAPVWDGNETWLVLGGGGLLGVFPVAYAVLLPAFYLPLLIMLIALIFRGVAFEFRFKVDHHKSRWNHAFFLGSLLATFAQGLVLGAFVQGIPHDGRQYTGGALHWLTPFAVMTGCALVAGYALLGATWLIAKTEGPLHEWAHDTALRLMVAVVGFMVLVSAWVPFLDTQIAARWFAWPNILYLSPVPILVGLVSLALFWAIKARKHYSPFLLALALFTLGYAGLGISLFPNVVPPDISIWQAASPPETQGFLLVGVLILLPVILGYTAYTYWVFRGKVTLDSGYH